MIKWYGEKLCDAGYIINLKKRNDRYVRARKNLRMAKISGVKRFDAVFIDDPVYNNRGCTQSHIEIAKKQIKNNWEYVLYLEDDIVLDYFYDLSIDESQIDKNLVSKNIIRDLNEYKPDVLWLGVRPESDTEKISNNLVSAKKTLMSHAYIGSLKYAKFLVENLRYMDGGHFSGSWPIDFFICQIKAQDCWRVEAFKDENFINNDLKIYISTPMIFNQGESYSDISYSDAKYEVWVRGCYQQFVNIDKLNIIPNLK